MAQLVKNGGTRASGESAADDWSDSNCYPPTSIPTAIGQLGGSGSIIFDDDEIDISAVSMNNAANGATYTLTSRTGNTTLKTVDATTRLFSHLDTADTANFIFENLTFDGSAATWTANSEQWFIFGQHCGDVTFRDCIFQNLTSTAAGHAEPVLVRFVMNNSQQTLTIEDCTVRDVDIDCAGDFHGLFKQEVGGVYEHIINIDGLTFQNIDVNCTSGTCYGLVMHTLNTEQCTMNNVTVDNVALHATTGEEINGIYWGNSSAGTFSGTGWQIDGFTLDGNGQANAAIKVQNGAAGHALSNVNVTDMWRTGRESGAGGNSIGGVIQIQGAGTVATVSSVNVSDSGGFYGIAAYATGGGELIGNNLHCVNIDDNGQLDLAGNNPINGLAFYAGGNGDATITDSSARNITGDSDEGLVIFGHHTTTGGTNDKAITLTNVEVTGVSGAAGSTVRVISSTTGQTLTTEFNNCEIEGITEIEQNANTTHLFTANGGEYESLQSVDFGFTLNNIGGGGGRGAARIARNVGGAMF